MSNTEPKPQVPNTVPSTDEERAAAAHEVQASTTKEKPRFSLGQKIGATAALLVVGAGAAFGVGRAVGGESNPDAKEPGVSASANPSEGPTDATEVESNVAKYGVSASEYPTFDLAAKAYFEKLGEYLSSASDTYDQPGDPERLNALLGEGWESNPELDDYGYSLQESSKTISTNHFATGENGSTEYEYNINVESVEDVEESDDQIAGLVTIHVTDNIMDTLLAMNNEVNLDSTGEHHFTLSNVDGYWRVIEFDNLNNN